MSQHDYLIKKKLGTILKEQNKLENVMSSDLYTKFKTMGVSEEVINTIPRYGQLMMDLSRNNDCAHFILCKNTNERPNRVLTMTDPMGKRGYGSNHGFNEYILHQKINSLIMPCKMFQQCDEFKHYRNGSSVGDVKPYNKQY